MSLYDGKGRYDIWYMGKSKHCECHCSIIVFKFTTLSGDIYDILDLCVAFSYLPIRDELGYIYRPALQKLYEMHKSVGWIQPDRDIPATKIYLTIYSSQS